MKVYYYHVPFVTNLFRNRIKIAIELAEIKDTSTLIDIGCASGYLLKQIRKLNKLCTCFGIDHRIPIHAGRLENCGIILADAKKIPFPDQYFNKVFVLDILGYIKEVDITINEIERVLKPNGMVIVSSTTESWFYKFCRYLWIRKLSVEGYPHLQNIYEIEKKFESKGFKLIKQKSLPGMLLPNLFRISKYKKIK